MRIPLSLILLILVLICEFTLLNGITRRNNRHRRRVAPKHRRAAHRIVRQAPPRNLRRGFGPVRPARAFPAQRRSINPAVTQRPNFRGRPQARLQAPAPRRPNNMASGFAAGPPGIRPPRGVADRLNRAKLKDFMSLGAFLLRRQRS